MWFNIYIYINIHHLNIFVEQLQVIYVSTFIENFIEYCIYNSDFDFTLTKSIPKGRVPPVWDVASQPLLKPKNRFKNILPCEFIARLL